MAGVDKDLARRISGWIAKKVLNAGCEGVVVGLSGGIDSSVTAVLSKMAFPNTTLGIIMPCFSDPTDLKHAKLLAGKFNIPTKTVELESVFKELLNQMEGTRHVEKNNIAVANIKPRLRMVTIYYFANKMNYLVAGTGNKSEKMIGYFTKYGDGGADILPLGGLLKTQVKELARELGIPKEIIEKMPSAGLWEGQTDEGEIGITYEELDRTLLAIESGDLAGCNPKTVEKVKRMIAVSEHKRNPAPVFEL